MKQIFSIILMLVLLFSSNYPTTVHATGDGNIDAGGGDMGGGTSSNSWTPGNEGVRITVVRASDHIAVTTPIDLTNKTPAKSIFNFGKISKMQYSNGTSLTPIKGGYTAIKTKQPIPKIISTNGTNNIEAIKSYFTDEQVIRAIAEYVGMDFNVLSGGEYKLLLEPLAYYKFEGNMFATTATEAALYDETTSGLLRKRMGTLTHKNLPLAMFLEVSDLGYPAWSGSTTSAASNSNIKSSLGLGIVRFTETPEPPEVEAYDYEYRINTEVITSVTISGGQSDPDNPVSATFHVNGRTHHVSNIYYPENDSQLAWIRWTTPDTPQTMTINVSVSGGGNPSNATINVNIVDLDKNPPPNPIADDRNDSYQKPSVPSQEEVTSTNWSVWSPWWQENWVWVSDWEWRSRGCSSSCSDKCSGGHGRWVDNGEWEDHGWWMYDLDSYRASLSASMSIKTDSKNPTANGNTMKSGYGINQTVTASLSTNQSSAVTGIQNAVTYFPEFRYENYWRLLECIGGSYNPTFEFKNNQYSTYNRRTHFTPIWQPDGSYTPYTYVLDSWTPSGMLSMNLTDSVNIQGNLWMDWHVAEQDPD